MDIRRLVGYVADALGPDASADRVEAIAAAILDAALEEAPARPSADPGNLIIVTAFGHDRPGILAAVTNTVSGAGCNITDVSQKILQTYFTLIMIADISAMRITLAELQQQLTEAGEAIGVRVTAQHEDLFASMHRP